MAASSAALRPFSPALVVAICFTIAVIEGYDIQAIGVAAPAMAPDLGMNPAQVGLAGSAAMIGLIAGALLGGWISDRRGRKPVLVLAVAWFGVFSLASALASSADLLMAARFLTGLGFGGAMPNIIALAAETSAPGRQTGAVSAMFAGMPVGGALASLASGFLMHGSDWRMIFVIGGAVPVALTPIAALWLPETFVRGAARPSGVLKVLFGAGRAPRTLLLWPTFALTQMVLFLMLGWLPLLVVAKGLARQDGAASALAFNLAGAGGALAVGLMTDRLGPRRPLLAAYGLSFVAMFALAGAVVSWQVIALSAVAGFAVVGANLCLYGLAPRYYPAADRATGSGAAVAAGRVGSVAGPLMAGALRAAHAGPGEVLAWTLPIIAAAALALFGLTLLGRTESA